MSDYLPFALAFAVTAFVPGVESGVVLGVALSRRRRDVIPLALGLLAGKPLLLAVALAGASALAVALGSWFSVLRYLGAALILWLAARRVHRGITPMTAPAESNPSTTGRLPQGHLALFALGASLTATNPLALSVYFAILPGVVPPEGPWQAAPALGTIVVVIMGAAIAMYALLGHLLRSALRRRAGAIDVVAGGFLGMAAILIVIS